MNWSRYFWAKNIPDIRPIDWNWEMGTTLICHKLRAERDVPFSKEVLSSFKVVSSNLNGPIIQFPLLKYIRTKTYIRTAKSVLGSLNHDSRTFWLLAEYQCISTFTHICKWPWQLKLLTERNSLKSYILHKWFFFMHQNIGFQDMCTSYAVTVPTFLAGRRVCIFTHMLLP